jgi:hypothetical protein
MARSFAQPKNKWCIHGIILGGIALFGVDHLIFAPSSGSCVLYYKRLESLLDIRNTLENYIENGSVNIRPNSPCMTVETGLRVRLFMTDDTMAHFDIIKSSFPF